MRLLSVKPSPRQGKKYVAELQDNTGKKHVVHFGATGYEDFSTHHDDVRKERYLARHVMREDWKKSGVLTPGFWSRWVLWNKPMLHASVADVRRRFNL